MMVKIRSIPVGGGSPLVLFAGPCVVESRDLVLKTAEGVKKSAERYRVPVVFKSSYRKANRTSGKSFIGIGTEEALTILDLSPRGFARPLAKLVRSALANAEQKNEREQAGIDIDNLVIGKILVDQGPNMWRIRARAQGRAAWIQKKTTNVRVELSEE